MTTGEHPSASALAAFLDNELPQRQSRKVAWHLSRCDPCRSRFAELPGGQELLDTLFHDIPPEADDRADYGLVIARTYDQFVEREASFRRGREVAPDLLEELRRHPTSRQRVLAKNAARFASWPLADLLLETCAETWGDDPKESMHLAELALIVAERLDPEAHTQPLLNDLRARAWGHLGNTRRIVADLQGAQEAFERARAHLASGSRDPVEEAQVLWQYARLLRATRHLEAAHTTLDRVISIHRHVGDLHKAGVALLSKANVFQTQGEVGKAIETLGEAIEAIDGEGYPRIALGARHNLANYLIDAGRFMEAQAILSQSRDLYRRYADLSLRMRYHWVRGRAAIGLGQYDRAERSLLEARDIFLDHRAPYEAAEVSLELAQVYATQGRHADVERLAQETLEVFRPLGLKREAMAALILFREAAEATRASVGLLTELATRLRQVPK